jgi:hypothetical protein
MLFLRGDKRLFEMPGLLHVDSRLKHVLDGIAVKPSADVPFGLVDFVEFGIKIFQLQDFLPCPLNVRY